MTAADPLPGLLTGHDTSLKPPAPQAAKAPEPTTPGIADAPVTDEPLTQIREAWQDLRERLPETVALLKVIPHRRADRSECFQLEMYSHQDFQTAKDPEALDRQRRPGLTLADRLTGDVDLTVAEECYDELRDVADRPELTAWLTDLRRKIGDNLQLIIWDDTDFGIPWELFWHDMEDSPAWLGTVAEITRWVTVRAPERRHLFSAEKSTRPGGRILYFEDPDLVRSDNHSIVDPARHGGYVSCTSMKELLRALTSDAAIGPYGLVYVRCHGKHGDTRSEAMISGVSLLKLAGLRLRALHRSGPLVFLNACNSARQVPDSGPGDNASRNFAEVFLRAHASGVVATLAEVETNYSAALTRKIVDRARDGGVRIPAFLRDERASEARGLPADTLDLTERERRKILAFLRVSMFAYFGHPESVFTLAEP